MNIIAQKQDKEQEIFDRNALKKKKKTLLCQ